MRRSSYLMQTGSMAWVEIGIQRLRNHQAGIAAAYGATAIAWILIRSPAQPSQRFSRAAIIGRVQQDAKHMLFLLER
jgi:hypothetical protein